MTGRSDEVESTHSTSGLDVESFPERLRDAMNGRKKRSFARAAGVSETVLRKYLSGESTPNLERLLAIARAAGVSVAWLATGEGDRGGYGKMAGKRSGLSIGEAEVEYRGPDPGAIEHFKASEAAYIEALAAIDWKPPVLVREGIRTAMYAHGLTQEGAIYLLDMFRRQEEQDQNS